VKQSNGFPWLKRIRALLPVADWSGLLNAASSLERGLK